MVFKKKKIRKVSILQTIDILSDAKTLVLFRTIALADNKEKEVQRYPDSNDPAEKTKPTQKQYYSRMSNLIRSGLIKRSRGHGYSLTLFGKKVFGSQRIIEDAINAYLKLRKLKMSDELVKEAVASITDSFYRNQ